MERCGAKTRTGGECQKPAGWGTDHNGIGRCKLHGGNTATHKRGAELELQRRECDRLGLSIDISPAEALLAEVRETAGNVEFYRSLVRELPADPTPPVRTEVVGGPDDGKVEWTPGEPGIHGPTYHASGRATGESRPHIFVQLYNEERRHLVHVTTAALKVGLAQLQIEIAEQQGAQIAQVLKGVLTDLGVMDRPDLPQIVRKHLTLAAANLGG